MEAGYLGGLMDHSEVGFRGPFHDGLPNFSAEGLVGIGGVGQLGLQPLVGGYLAGLRLFVDVPGSLVQCVVSPFDVLEPTVGLVDTLSAEFVQVSEILLGLVVLVDDGADPTCRARNFQRWLNGG
jgi:hypothetical protein